MTGVGERPYRRGVTFPRRRLLALTAAAALGLSGCASGDDQGSSAETDPATDSESRAAGTRYPSGCVPRSALDTHADVGEAGLVYDISATRSRFAFDPGFYDQITAWLADWVALSGLAQPSSLWTYGTWIDGSSAGCRSWHHQGRAIDVSRLLTGSTAIVSARYDLWSRYTGDQRHFHEQRYWALAASLHDHFAYVLTHLYDASHHNHLHVDNGRSGSRRSEFDRGSRTQLQAVQAICTMVWGVDCEVTGRWDFATRRASRTVLERIGVDAALTADGAWRTFLRSTVTQAVTASAG